MSASGSGRWALDTALTSGDSEPLPDPREAAEQALIFAGTIDGAKFILDVLDEAGLTICWQVPRA